MEKKEKKDQFVIAYLTNLTRTDAVVSHAAFLSRMLNKGLILLHISDPKYTDLTTDQAGERLKEIQQAMMHGDFPSLDTPLADVTYCALKGESKPVINALPDLINAVVIVAEVDAEAKRKTPTHKKELLKNFEECKVAFLTVQEPLKGASSMKDVALSVDFKKESKEKFIWSSYYARFNASRIHVLSYNYKDEGLRYKWQSNIKFMQKLYDSLDIAFEQQSFDKRSTFTDVVALEAAHEAGYGLFIAVTTKEKDAAEIIIGVQEERIVVNRHRIPVLFINPREDIYVLCD